MLSLYPQGNILQLYFQASFHQLMFSKVLQGSLMFSNLVKWTDKRSLTTLSTEVKLKTWNIFLSLKGVKASWQSKIKLTNNYNHCLDCPQHSPKKYNFEVFMITITKFSDRIFKERFLWLCLKLIFQKLLHKFFEICFTCHYWPEAIIKTFVMGQYSLV